MTLDPHHAVRSSPEKGQSEGILSAAEACFARSGYARASMREIAEAARVSKSLLHYHFESKEHLFVEVQMRAYQRLSARVRAAAEPIAGGRARGLAAFDVLVQALRETDDMRVQSELWAAAISHPALRPEVARLRAFFRDLLAETMAELIEPELARLGLTPPMAADLLWSLLNGIGVELAFGAPGARADDALRAFRVLAGLALDEPSPTRASVATVHPNHHAAR